MDHAYFQTHKQIINVHINITLRDVTNSLPEKLAQPCPC